MLAVEFDGASETAVQCCLQTWIVYATDSVEYKGYVAMIAHVDGGVVGTVVDVDWDAHRIGERSSRRVVRNQATSQSRERIVVKAVFAVSLVSFQSRP